MAAQNQGDLFDAYFKRADLDGDGRISGAEAVAFFQGSNLPKQVLAQIWTYADQNRTSYLGRPEFYNALKLVTVAQSKRELTPEIVRAALYGSASGKIPAPQINLSSTVASQPNAGAVLAPSPMGPVTPKPTQNFGLRGAPVSSSTSMNMSYNRTPQSGLMRPTNAVPGVASLSAPGVGFQGFPHVGPSPVSNMANARASTGAGVASAGGRGSATAAGASPPAVLPERGSSPLSTQAGFPSGAPGASPKSLVTSGVTLSGTPAMQARPTVSQNGFSSGSFFGGDAFSATSSRTNLRGPVSAFAGSVPASSAMVPVSGATHSPNLRSPAPAPTPAAPNSFIPHPIGGQPQKLQSPVKHNEQVPVQNLPLSGPRAAPPHSSAGLQSQLQWPRPTPTDLQKYSKVFMEVDNDKDGKITGEQARNLFLSWRLPREILKQVWDLSDQDSDSMLSLREFCIALYLMERYREGRPLPTVLPSNIVLDFPATAQQTGGAAWGYSPSPGLQQQTMPSSAGARPPRPSGRPPLPSSAAFSDDKMPPKQQKSKVPVLEKHLVDQLSEDEQKSLNLKFQEASEANKKVEELEKEITESREKMDFYRVKMQELVLYKSRCDSHLNEVSERAAGDKLEVESLAKKYEEKYRQSGDVASKLTIEEATFRDIQERKMEMYQAIVKLEPDGSGEKLQVHADGIQSSLEDLIKFLCERCKKYGLRAKPSTLVELPFGWQPGIQEGAADWDEVWDKFEEEGFGLVKELTLDVQNSTAPPRTRVKLAKKENTSGAEGEAAVLTSDGESKPVRPATETDRLDENGVIGHQKEDVLEERPVASPSAGGSRESARGGSKDNHFRKTTTSVVSPCAKGTLSDIGVPETSLFGEKSFDEAASVTFDVSDDANSVSGISKEMDRDNRSDDLFGHGEWTLPPIKTGSSLSVGFLPKGSIFADSVPGTPADGFLPKKSIFADSVPGTPADGFLPKKSLFADSVPGTPADSFLPKKSMFADSVPSTPLYGSNFSPRKPGEGVEEHGYNFSRFDSFKSTDSGFHPQEGLSRFDSFRSTTDFDPQDGASYQQRETFSRFDSMRSTNDFDYGRRFSSFDDQDAFGSGPFKSSFGSETPRREDAFRSNDPFRSYLGSETPRSEVDPFGSVAPFRSSLTSETPRTDSDPFGSVGPFRSSLGSETPRADADPFGSVGPFGSSLVSETPRRESDYFAYSGSFKSSFGNETPRGELDYFGFGGPFGSSLGSETPRRETDAFASSGPFRSSVSSETPKGGTDGWSAF